MITSILIGLFGLGIVVTIHEYGHLIAAKSVGVGVQVFSLGWGKKIFGFERAGTEYRISMFPIGGYVRLKGEEALADACAKNAQSIAHIDSGFFSVAAWKRIIIASGGPIFNIIAACITFTTIFSIGYNMATYDNRIVLVSEFDQNRYAADDAGMQSGDRIISINGHDVDYFFHIREHILSAHTNEVAILLKRNSNQITVHARAQFNNESGTSILGVYPWINPVIGHIVPGSSADIAGLITGDTIMTLNGEPIKHSVDFNRLIRLHSLVNLTVERNGQVQQIALTTGEDKDGHPETGITFLATSAEVKSMNIARAAAKAFQEITRIFALTVRGIISIFSGARFTNVVAGPIQLTSVIGEVAKSGSEEGVWSVMRLFFNFLAIINVALCFMNLLPVPILDGGQIVLYAYEALRRKQINPRVIMRYQQIGVMCVLLLLVLALMSDFIFLFN